jgi:leucyl-tRNA synthetase
MGHVRNYTIGDVVSRYQRMQGKNVTATDGLGRIRFAGRKCRHEDTAKPPPANWTYENIDYMKNQLKQLGFGYDWSRELATCDRNTIVGNNGFLPSCTRKGLVYKKCRHGELGPGRSDRSG